MKGNDNYLPSCFTLSDSYACPVIIEAVNETITYYFNSF